MAHQLILAYGLHKKMNIYNAHRATMSEMTTFHGEDYIKHLKRVCPNIYNEFEEAAHSKNNSNVPQSILGVNSRN
eukprot:CAMPEP_0116875456 /NCGR_PEP_ID=MMETSP0463-20121206/7424_1 /TAXON_ID=181622 /ORGANISM="Strombidinopsis sp, Strain SopsisLIS2011" /LENGTH=74 /DNA_ID=CAMNT_0004521131 /DNA_START=28 /DNA_END=252 /DNA_ORIENTATION=+